MDIGVLIVYFTLYSFLGWCTEVLYYFKKEKHFVNRGFLNGPFCPIYGFGAVILIVLLHPFQNSLFYLFLGATFLTSALEYFTGFILERFFHSVWWDYSDNALNIKGRICLSFSLLWGLGSLLIVKYFQPLISNLVYNIPRNILYVLDVCVAIYFLLDFILSVNSLVELTKISKQLKDISIQIKSNSEAILVRAKASALEVEQKFSSLKENSALELEQKVSSLKESYETLSFKLKGKHLRFLKAFPTLKYSGLTEIFNDIRSKITSLLDK